MWRAMRPVIWRTSTRPCAVSSPIHWDSLRTADSGCRASRHSPGRCSSHATVPSQGARFTWQDTSDMKMPMRTAGPPTNSGSVTGPTSVTVPSAGATKRPGPAGMARSKSRKNTST